MRLILKGSAAALVALVIVGGSANATTWCESSLVLDLGGAAYVADYGGVECLINCMYWNIRVYAESNGEPGLQRGGTTLLGDVDWCQDSESPDLGVL